jgi:hypothetical protein
MGAYIASRLGAALVGSEEGLLVLSRFGNMPQKEAIFHDVLLAGAGLMPVGSRHECPCSLGVAVVPDSATTLLFIFFWVRLLNEISPRSKSGTFRAHLAPKFEQKSVISSQIFLYKAIVIGPW